MSQKKTLLLQMSLVDFFRPALKKAMKDLEFEVSDSSCTYIYSLLETKLINEGSVPKESDLMLAEALLQAIQEQEVHKKKKHLKNLGESILFKAGFFADSFKRKIIGVSYYVQMGRATYQSLYEASPHPVYKDLSDRFPGYVDLFSAMGSEVSLIGQDDVLSLFDRYHDLGSGAAHSKLVEMGVFPADAKKASNQ